MDSDIDCGSVNTQIPAFEPVFYSKIYQMPEPSIQQDPDDKSCKFPPLAIQYLKLKEVPPIFKAKIDDQSVSSLLNDIEENQQEQCISLLNKKNIKKTIVTTQWLNKDLLTTNQTTSFHAWKEVNADKGDSFYTCFGYSLFMQFILKQQSLNPLIFDILNNFQINIPNHYENISFAQTKFILKTLHENSNKNPQSLLNAFYEYYNIFDEFDKVLKLYIRFCIYRYIKRHFKKEYTYVLDEGSEPYPKEFIFMLLSKLFNISLHITEPSLNNSSKLLNPFLLKTLKLFQNKINSNNKSFLPKNSSKIYNDKKDSICLYIVYHQNHYHIYTNDTSVQITNYLYNSLTFDMTNVTLSSNEICNLCNDKTHLKLLYQDECNRFVLCQKCLNEHIENIMKQRVEKYRERNQYNKELYLRPIHFQDKIYLRDVIISKVFTEGNATNKSYLSYLFDTYINKCCVKCNKITNETNLTKAECGCDFHNECYRDIIMENIKQLSTDSYNFFLREKTEKNGKMEFTCMKCKKPYYENIFEYFSKDKMQEFNQQIKKTFMSYCIGCGEEIGKKNKHITQININPLRPDGNKCKIIINDEHTPHDIFKDLYHYLCDSCVTNTIRKDEGKDIIPKCFFCRQSHNISYSKLNYVLMNYPVKKK